VFDKVKQFEMILDFFFIIFVLGMVRLTYYT